MPPTRRGESAWWAAGAGSWHLQPASFHPSHLSVPSTRRSSPSPNPTSLSLPSSPFHKLLRCFHRHRKCSAVPRGCRPGLRTELTFAPHGFRRAHMDSTPRSRTSGWESGVFKGSNFPTLNFRRDLWRRFRLAAILVVSEPGDSLPVSARDVKLSR